MGRDAGNSFSEALSVRVSGNSRLTFNNSLGQFDPLDFYKVRLTGRSTVFCKLRDLDGNADLTLYDDDGHEIASSENDDDEKESFRKVLAKGTYYIRVNRISSDINYNIRFLVAQDGGDDIGEAIQLKTRRNRATGKIVYRDFIGGNSVGDDDDEFDYYRIDLDDDSFLNCRLVGLRADADITLLDSRGQEIFISANTGNRSEFIREVVAAGTYYLKINVKTGFTRYNLKIRYNTVDFDFDDVDIDDDDFESANLITFTTSTTEIFQNFIGVSDPDDFYRVDLATPSSFNVTLANLTADANLELLSSDGTTVLDSSLNPGTVDDVVNASLAAGTYFVRVFPADTDTTTAYSLDFAVAPLQTVGLTDDNQLVAFNPDQPELAVQIPVIGLDDDETLRGIDFRPATGELFGVTDASALYVIDLATGEALNVNSAALSPELLGAGFGIDFDPVSDRLRVVTSDDQNQRIDPFLGITTATDTPLSYDAADANAAADPNVTAIAYSNNFFITGSSTAYGIDTALDTLVRLGDASGTPNGADTGLLFTVGALGADFSDLSGFDISTSDLVNRAYGVSGSTLYSVNLATGAVTGLGTVTAGETPVELVGLAVRA
jgi:hypothetical protein